MLLSALMKIFRFLGQWWRILILFCCACLFSVSAFAGVYNFYFGDKGKKHKAAQQIDADEEKEDTEESGGDEGDRDTVKASGGQQPIVINNVNNNDNVNKQVNGTSIPQPAAVPVNPPTLTEAPPLVPFTPHESRAIVSTPSRILPIRFWLGAGTIHEDHRARHNSVHGGTAGIIGLGYQLSKPFAIDLYGGAFPLDERHKYGYGGLDLSFLPFRIPITERWDLFQLGFLVGVSTLSPATPDNIGSIHGGVRANLNLGERFTMMGQAKANLGSTQLELALVTHF